MKSEKARLDKNGKNGKKEKRKSRSDALTARYSSLSLNKLMAISVVMPALEMAQETGKVISWKKKEGERVTKGEALLEIETDKAVVEIEATGDGILAGGRAPGSGPSCRWAQTSSPGSCNPASSLQRKPPSPQRAAREAAYRQRKPPPQR